MASIPKETIQVIGQTCGIELLTDSIAETLALDVTYRIRQLVQDALKLQRHSCRAALNTQDIEEAMRLRNYSPIYGYSAPAAIAFRAVPSSIQQGAGGSDSLALSAALTNILPNQVTSAITHGVEDQNLFFLDNYEVKFEEMISGLMGTVKIPVDPTFSVHWLAIEGVQPAIPQNPAPMHTAKLDNSAEFQAKDVSAISGIEGVPVVTKPLVKHVLSKEQLQYFEYIRYAIKQGSCPSANLSDTDVQLLNAALTSISSDAGLHQLMPYFAQFINDEVNKNLTNLYMLKSLMRMTRAILNSPHLHVEPYLHQLMPPILTCLVGRTLCESASQDHWSLRDFAASLVALVCRKFGETYQSLQPRITKTLTKAFLDPKRSLSTHYGAIVGLRILGDNVIRILIIPNLRTYLELLNGPLSNNRNLISKLEAQKCLSALILAVGSYVGNRYSELKFAAMESELATTLERSFKRRKHSQEMINDAGTDNEVENVGVLEVLSTGLFDIFDCFGDTILPFYASRPSFLDYYI